MKMKTLITAIMLMMSMMSFANGEQVLLELWRCPDFRLTSVKNQ